MVLILAYHKEVLTPKGLSWFRTTSEWQRQNPKRPSFWQVYFQPTARCCFSQNGHSNEFLELYHSPSRAKVSPPPLPLGLDGMPVCFNKENIAEVMSYVWVPRLDHKRWYSFTCAFSLPGHCPWKQPPCYEEPLTSPRGKMKRTRSEALRDSQHQPQVMWVNEPSMASSPSSLSHPS